ncbi:aldo/keto reductase [Rhizorhabdus dicambivorans]|uniref:Aldo/keto reductase n=2 Tax=Rhizorhabdus dicambivorans TaxID=1850238 RepID=A0A2A4FZP4_9SPHN|nr:aldo/keto reductase [Rhizorhabdus dicambivorans]PCE42902.1 aldo/keto reductase [Rhizorhabdus dicambivorans]
MRYALLGDTGLFVSRLSLGALTFGAQDGDGLYQMIGNLDQPTVNRLVGHALERGVNLIDTANVYADGRSEVAVGQALKDLGVRRSDVIVATKFFSRTGPGPNDIGASRAHIMASVEASLKRLGTDHVDLYQMHGQDPITPEEETLRALDDLVAQGKVRYVGCSNWQAWKLMKALALSDRRGLTRFQSLQAYYSIAGRDLEREIAPLLQDQRVGLMVWGALAWGLLSGKYRRDGEGGGAGEGRRAQLDYPPVDRERAWACVDAMREIGDAHGVSVARVAIAWLLSRPCVSTIVIGARNLDQLDDNLAALELELGPEELARLDAVSALPPEYPGWAVELMNKTRLPQPGQGPGGLGDRLRQSAAENG